MINFTTRRIRWPCTLIIISIYSIGRSIVVKIIRVSNIRTAANIKLR